MSLVPFSPGWYLLYTMPKQEKTVAKQLASWKIDYYLPMVKRRRKWSDRVKTIEFPLFPSYLFIYLKQLNDYYVGLDLKGVLQYVKCGKNLAKVSDDLISDLRAAIESGRIMEVIDDVLKKGDQLLIEGGPLAGLKGELIRYKNKELIIIRVTILKRSILLTLPIDDVHKDSNNEYSYTKPIQAD
ncbi:MAG: antitermination protein NusG [Flavobacterium psychrophilum]|nr:MAG: antitermination protein NusG [Flavobacterium psychrophilum]